MHKEPGDEATVAWHLCINIIISPVFFDCMKNDRRASWSYYVVFGTRVKR